MILAAASAQYVCRLNKRSAEDQYVTALLKIKNRHLKTIAPFSITMVQFKLFESEPPSANEEVARLRLRMSHQSLQELQKKKDSHVEQGQRRCTKGETV
ncbi:hypothetical protein NDI54_21145 [Haloarcula sp. S1AR25-5A]|uniref:Uncharacterized protein n=1 Tax=Haloarcula terrestris TaxID=2950533 RepID=A0AAE4JIJ9_9EURY|nr:hypothetical protein [Haloarcula terrestris]MDS0223837.1 hypothetical protein [Haloarcula terrestris]